MSQTGGGLSRLATLPLLQRLVERGKPPLRLIGVARDHVTGSKTRGEQLLAGRFVSGGEVVELSALNWGSIDPATPVGAELHGFAWLRDLAAAATREKGAPLAEDLAGRWLLAHGAKVDAAWAPELWGERLISPPSSYCALASARDSPVSALASRAVPEESSRQAAVRPAQAVIRGRPGAASSAVPARWRAARAAVFSRAER